jgi:mannose-6-phosphate isomerase-like protein (cupin superfamily)
MSVKIIADRGTSYEPNPPEDRIFRIEDFAHAFDPLKPTRTYTGEDFRVATFRMRPGQEQEPHIHPETTHAWFVLTGTGDVTMEDERHERVGPGTMCIHPRSTVHGIRNVGDDDLIYVVLSVGR